MRPVALRFFDALVAYRRLEDEAGNATLAAAGFDPEEPSTWVCSDITFDDYDASFEWKHVRGGWEPNAETIAKWAALGFSRCWLCHGTKGERDYAEQYIQLAPDVKVYPKRAKPLSGLPYSVAKHDPAGAAEP